LIGRSSSYVGMWALEPSLLELLIGKLHDWSTAFNDHFEKFYHKIEVKLIKK
jgi:hypothetical protein